MDAILTSDVIGAFKPNPSVYRTALKALQCEESSEQVAMVAAHAYDLEAAAKLLSVHCCDLPVSAHRNLMKILCRTRYRGFKTIYIVRDTEDVGLDPARFEKFDLVIREGGIAELARRLEAV